ncbi:unnamed protein product [[Candida] boidinii]|nr:unnamed protein product [[Candida] boidinii]
MFNNARSIYGFSPQFLAFGRQYTSNPQVGKQLTLQKFACHETDIFLFDLDSIHIASYNRKAAADRLKITNDKRTHIRDQLQRLGSRFYSQNEFQKGEWVLKQRQKRHKHEPTFEGPFLVINKTEKNSYTLQGPNGLTLPGTYHISHLRPAFQYYGSPLR